MQYQLFSESSSSLEEALRLLLSGNAANAFLKFLSANDVGETGSHQSGLYLPREAAPLFVGNHSLDRGENLSKEVVLEYRGMPFRGVFHWWGRKKGECHLTGIRGMFDSDRANRARLVGSLFVLIPAGSDTDGLFAGTDAVDDRPRFQAWIFEDGDEIQSLLDVLGISPAETNRLLRFDLSERLRPECEAFARQVGTAFPSGEEIARQSRLIYSRLYGALDEDADAMILRLIEIEYSLFRFFERSFYEERLRSGFETIEDFLSLSLEVHNRRKSRAGQSLELHLEHVFQTFGVACERGCTTSDHRRPDFLFPSLDAYEEWRRQRGGDGQGGPNPKATAGTAPQERHFFLASKTTCKDRWRQILAEVDLPKRYLFTLQQAISSAQLREMEAESVKVVLPEAYRSRFPAEDRRRTINLMQFILMVREAGCQRRDLFSAMRES